MQFSWVIPCAVMLMMLVLWVLWDEEQLRLMMFVHGLFLGSTTTDSPEATSLLRSCYLFPRVRILQVEVPCTIQNFLLPPHRIKLKPFQILQQETNPNLGQKVAATCLKAPQPETENGTKKPVTSATWSCRASPSSIACSTRRRA